MREQFAARLQRRGKKIDVHRCKGMFFLLNLDQSQVLKLRDQYAVYVLNQGRVSVTGLNQQNLDYVVDSVINVIP
jgi:aspartate/tyrosine/aromatic aminotransferase